MTTSELLTRADLYLICTALRQRVDGFREAEAACRKPPVSIVYATLFKEQAEESADLLHRLYAHMEETQETSHE